MNSGLTPEQKAKAVQAARDIQWNDKQIERFERLYRNAVSAGDFEEADGVAEIIDWHQQNLDAARQVLRDLGL